MKRKTLLELILQRRFRPSRHHHLLATDRSVGDDEEIRKGDPRYEIVMRVLELQLLYCSSSDDRERLTIARAIGAGVNDDRWGGYFALMGANPGLRWVPTSRTGEHRLDWIQPAPPAHQRPSRLEQQVGRVAAEPAASNG